MTTFQIVSLIVAVILALLGGFLIFKKANKNKIFKLITLFVYAVLVILWIILKDHRQLIGLITVLVTTVLAGYFIARCSKSNSLGKWVLLFILLALAFTWIFEYGIYNGTEYVTYGMNVQGITDVSNYFTYAINFALDKLIFLAVLGAFYAVLTKSNGYKKLVINIAEKMKGKEILFAVITSLVFALMASLFSQTFIALVFVPFVVSILLNMKLDKLTAFAVTFGSVLIGVLGVTYGGEGLYWFNYYTNTTFNNAFIYRVLVLVVAFILFNFFNILHIKKVLKENNVNEIESDPFKVENIDKKAKSWPIVVLLIVMFIFLVLGYVGWETNFKITVFADFHKWLTELKIGDEAIFKMILGSKVSAFGAWDLNAGISFMVFMSIITALVGRVNLNEFIEAYSIGLKKMAKSIILFIGIYMVMIVAYQSPFIPTITNVIFKNVTTFNPYLVSISALLSNIFHADLGLTGYLVGGYFISVYGANVDVIHIIFTSLYGFVGIFAPTSVVLMIGLSYLDIDYKTWFKYIWLFALALLVILMVLFTVMTYI